VTPEFFGLIIRNDENKKSAAEAALFLFLEKSTDLPPIE